MSEVGGIRLAPVDQEEYERAVEHIRGCMGEAEIARLRRRGRAMEPAAVLELALSGDAERVGPARVETGPGEFSSG